MTLSELIVAEYKARRNGKLELADKYQTLRWQIAMGLIVNAENSRASCVE